MHRRAGQAEEEQGEQEVEGAFSLPRGSLLSVERGVGRSGCPVEMLRSDETEGGSEGAAGVEVSTERRTSTLVVPIWGPDQGQEGICFLLAGEGRTPMGVSWEYQLGWEKRALGLGFPSDLTMSSVDEWTSLENGFDGSQVPLLEL